MTTTPAPVDAAADAQARAEATVRAWCGWHVAPERSEVLTLDGPGGPTLVLPSLHVVDIASITEGGVVLDPAAYSWSAAGMVRRHHVTVYDEYPSHWPPVWTDAYRAVVVDLTHGFTEMPADVQGVIDRLAARTGLGGNLAQVGAVRYAVGADGLPVSETLTPADEAVLAPYRLPKLP